jgi:predicted membrane-bound dolichyl-phosphate-mannose-protein mannosyltransferase
VATVEPKLLTRAASAARYAWDEVKRTLAHRRAPLIALALILLCSAAARVFRLGDPCSHPCKRGSDHTLIFDEAYYVNAARVIAGIHPPAGASYHDAPLGKDPNAEHPQLAKLVIAGGIKLFGDNQWGWRLGSVLFSLIAIATMYALVRAAGGGAWFGVGAAGVMALDNLMLVHGRIATLDVYAVAGMLAAAVLYMRKRHLLAGLALAVAICMKEVAVYLVLVVAMIELLRALRDRNRGWLPDNVRPFAVFLGTGVVALVLLLWLLDLTVPAYDAGTHITYGGSPFRHLSHIYTYALKLKAVPHATGISSSPWDWLVNQKPIEYARVAVNSVSDGKVTASRPLIAFRGEMNPFIIFLAIPALAAAAAALWRDRDEIALVGVAWFAGTFLPFVSEYNVSHRITYLYYMLIVMPGLYLVTTRLFSPRVLPVAAAIGWAIALVYGFGHLYPLRTLAGH